MNISADISCPRVYELTSTPFISLKKRLGVVLALAVCPAEALAHLDVPSGVDIKIIK